MRIHFDFSCKLFRRFACDRTSSFHPYSFGLVKTQLKSMPIYHVSDDLLYEGNVKVVNQLWGDFRRGICYLSIVNARRRVRSLCMEWGAARGNGLSMIAVLLPSRECCADQRCAFSLSLLERTFGSPPHSCHRDQIALEEILDCIGASARTRPLPILT